VVGCRARAIWTPGIGGRVAVAPGSNRRVSARSASSHGGKFVGQRRANAVAERQSLSRRRGRKQLCRGAPDRSVRCFLDLKWAANGRNIQNIDVNRRLPPSASETVMPDTRYYVVRHDMVWLIKFEDEEYGPYETQDEALRLATDAAEQLERHGESVEVHLVGL